MTERTAIIRKVRKDKRYRETQSQLVVHTAIMNKFESANIPWHTRIKAGTCRSKAAPFNSLTRSSRRQWVDPRKDI